MHLTPLFRRLPFALISRSRAWLYFYRAVTHARRWPMRGRQMLRRLAPPNGQPIRLAQHDRHLFLLGNPSAGDIRRVWKTLAAQGLSQQDVHFVCQAADVPSLGLGRFPHTTLQSIWTDTAADIRIHGEWHACRERRMAAAEAVGLADEMRSLESDYTSIEIFFRRLAAAVERGVASPARAVIVITHFLGPETRHLLQHMPEFPPFSTLSLRGGTVRMARATPAGFGYGALLRRLRYISLPSLWMQGPDLEARRLARLAPGADVVIVTEGLPSSSYWPGIAGLLRASRAEGLDVLLLTSSWAIVLAAKAIGIPAAIPRLLLLPPNDPGFDDRARRFLELASSFAETHSVDAPTRAAMIWLASRQRVAELSVAHETRVVTEGLLRYTGAKAVVVQPHWSVLAMTAAIAAHKAGALVVSAPTMTVAANHASILGWEQIDIIPCYGNQCVAAFEGMGVPREKLPIIGNMSYDAALRLDQEKARQILRSDYKVRLPNRKTIILIATSSIDSNEIDWIADIAALCAERQDAGLFVKLHPSFQSLEARMRQRLPASISVVNSRCPITEAIAASDIVVTDYSSVGAQARLMDKKLIVVNMMRQVFPANDYVALGIADSVSSPDDLRRVFTAALDNPAPEMSEPARRFIEAYNYMNDGRSAERLCRLLVELPPPRGKGPE